MTGWVMTNHPVILILGMRRSYTLYAKTAFYAVSRTFYSVIVKKELKTSAQKCRQNTAR